MGDAQTTRAANRRRSRVVATLALATASLIAGAAPAGAHGGDADKIHGCFGGGNGKLEIVGPNTGCKKNETALDWPAVDTNTTYAAGSGLSLSEGNVFSVTGAPWSGLTGVPAGFADGVDDVGGGPGQWDAIEGVPAGFADGVDDVGLTEVGWGDIGDIPADLLDGDDDGSAGVTVLKSELAVNDGQPNEAGDLVSFSEIKDLTDKITSDFIQDGTIRTRDLAGSDAGPTVAGAVTGEKILDGSIEGRDLGGVVQVTTDTVDPPAIPANSRVAVTMTSLSLSGVKPSDLVTVSPPALLAPGVLFTGSDVLSEGEVTIYLTNVTNATIDPISQVWTVRSLITAA